MPTTNPLDEIQQYEDDGIPSYKFDTPGEIVEGVVFNLADDWTPPKRDQWDNLVCFLPFCLRTDDGKEFRFWPKCSVYEDTGRKAPKEFAKSLAAATKGLQFDDGGRLKIRYDGPTEKENKKGQKYTVDTFTMKYVEPPKNALASLGEDEEPF